MGVSVDELWAVMKGEADEQTRSRVADALEANDPELMKLLESRKERIARVSRGSMDFRMHPSEHAQ